MAMDFNYDNISDELLAAFLDGNVDVNEAITVLSSLSQEPEIFETLALSPQIDKEVSDANCRILPMYALAAANEENLCSFYCETFILRHLDYDIDHWSLLETAKANNWVREEGTPLHLVGKLLELKGLFVKRKYDTTLQELSTALDEGCQVIVVLDRNVLDGNFDEKSPSYHAVCVTSVEDDGAVMYLDPDTLLEKTIEKEDFLKAWRSSGKYMVTASETAEGYNPQPIDVTDIQLDASLEELTEAIAENAHDIWARARMNEGWTYGPVRDDAKKHHPDLVPYSKLPESEKEYDRIMAMNTLRLMRRLGYKIVND